MAFAANGDLYVGGAFTKAGTVAAANIARWNGTVWSALGKGLTGTDASCAVIIASGNAVYAGGTFTQAGGTGAKNVARWNGAAWSALGTGTDGKVSSLAMLDTSLFVGGVFKNVGGKVSVNLAKADLSPQLPVPGLDPVTGISTTAATLRGFVNPNGFAATAVFQYGLTTAYDSTVPASNDSSVVMGVSAQITGLAVGSLYHYRLTATNEYGSNSVTGTFTTRGSGSLDNGFSGDGSAIHSWTLAGSARSAAAHAMVIQPDGKIVAAGAVHNGTNNDFALIRYMPDGSLDPSFDSDPVKAAAGTGSGKVVTDFGAEDMAHAVALQSDGKIVLAGYATVVGNRDFALARYLTTGELDTSFDEDGKVTTAFNLGGSGTNTDVASTVLIQPTGEIVAMGYANAADGFHDVALLRYLDTGSLDTTFDGDGKKTFAVGIHWDFASSGALLPGGKILCAGVSTTSGPADFFVARLLSNGALDTADFGTSGIRKVAIQTQDDAYTMLVQADGKIVVGGLSDTASNGETGSCCLIRLNSDARSADNTGLDTSFDGDGRALYSFGGTFDSINNIALQADGKIVAVGMARISGQDHMTLLRVNVNGGLDATFGIGGNVQLRPEGRNARLNDLAMTADGKIVAVGRSDHSSGRGDFALVRVLGLLSPEISVRHPLSTELVDGAGLNLGNVLQGTQRVLEIQVRNLGSDYLTGVAASLSGTDAGLFAIATAPTGTVGPELGSTRMVLRLLAAKTTSPGGKTALLRIMSNDADESPFDIPLTMNVLAPTTSVISVQPAPVIAEIGEPAEFSVTATDVVPLSYAWRIGTKAIPGATSATYDVEEAAVTNAAILNVQISNGVNTTTSLNTALAVLTPMPAFQQAVLNKPVTLNVRVTVPSGATLAYQWLKDEVALTNVGKYSGVTSAALKISGVTTAEEGDYQCRLTLTTPAGSVTRTTEATEVGLVTVPVIDPLYTLDPLLIGQEVDLLLPTSQYASRFTATGLPPGVVLDQTGALTGRPLAPRMVNGVPVAYQITFTAANDAGVSAPHVVLWMIQPLAASLAGNYVAYVGLGDGLLTLNVTPLGSYTGLLRIGGSSYPLAGVLTGETTTRATLTQMITRSATLEGMLLECTVDHSDPIAIFGQLDIPEEAQLLYLSGYYSGWSSRQRAVGYPGLYNAVLSARPAPPAPPPGHGYLSLRISDRGSVSALGRLGDGIAINSSSFLGADGELYLYSSLYQEGGSIFTYVGVTAGSGEVSGGSDWEKAAKPGTRSYADGFDSSTLDVTGGRWAAPAAGVPLLGTNAVSTRSATLTLSEGGLGDETLGLSLSSNHRVTITPGNPLPLRLTVQPTSGLFFGSFTLSSDPGTRPRTCAFTGLLLPNTIESAGYGHFNLPQLPATSQSPILSGAVELKPTP